MSVTELMINLRERGIQLEAHGDRLRYSPKAAMTPELAERVKAHKPALLAILMADDIPAMAVWQKALDRLEGESQLPPEVLAANRRASVHWENSKSHNNDAIKSMEDPNFPDKIDELAEPECDRCRATVFRDTEIHAGRSTRRDCARCGRMIGFPRWYETTSS